LFVKRIGKVYPFGVCCCSLNFEFANNTYKRHPNRVELENTIKNKVTAVFASMTATQKKLYPATFAALMPLEVQRQVQQKFANMKQKLKNAASCVINRFINMFAGSAVN
jgi:hypothetical protein